MSQPFDTTLVLISIPSGVTTQLIDLMWGSDVTVFGYLNCISQTKKTTCRHGQSAAAADADASIVLTKYFFSSPVLAGDTLRI